MNCRGTDTYLLSEVDKPDQLERNTLDLHKEAVRLPHEISAWNTLTQEPKISALFLVGPVFGRA